jgi:hypothetical protein
MVSDKGRSMTTGHLERITKLSSGKLKVYLSLDVGGVEEEASREYDNVSELPAGLVDANQKYRKKQPILASGVGRDAVGFYFNDVFPQGK